MLELVFFLIFQNKIYHSKEYHIKALTHLACSFVWIYCHARRDVSIAMFKFPCVHKTRGKECYGVQITKRTCRSRICAKEIDGSERGNCANSEGKTVSNAGEGDRHSGMTARNREFVP